MTALAFVLATYALASISFPQLLARAHSVDLHAFGTRNLGAGNLVRAAGVVPGVAAGLLDALKPPLAILFTEALGADRGTQLACAVVSIAAQQWPLWHRFDGGRGNSSAIALYVALSIPASVIASIALLLGLVPGTIRRLRTRERVYSRGTALGNLIAFLAWPIVGVAIQVEPRAVLAGAATALLIVARRLTAGLRADLAVTDDPARTLAYRLFFDRSELQRRALVEEPS